ncbi:polycomb group protein EMBRYONIC FLOWER 2-like isoform X2 [Panicum miliaceum]|uniref:Polycomb group protein EMBRYONIC FLOWER 2-like isoform X2 n=1 Tax=Panicum miliaceum TaxID=4540 RepID=A0A3L6PV75_PANMI|nr:polycomb group protein EMBRYONIC FLOWER 2-like isoform X2 [Panicum miliaceum]
MNMRSPSRRSEPAAGAVGADFRRGAGRRGRGGAPPGPGSRPAQLSIRMRWIGFAFLVPSFLQRNLCYKIHAKQKKRIEITISLSGSSNPEVQAQNIFPLYALFAKPISAVSHEGHSPVYQFSRACLLTCFDESGRNNHTEATFIFRYLKTLANIILVSCGQVGQTPDENNFSKSHMENPSLEKLGGQCFWGKIPNGLLSSSLENCVDLSLGWTKQFALPITMNPGFIEPKFLKQNSCLTFCSRKLNAVCPYQLQVSICAQEAGARDMFKSPYNYHLYNDVPPSSLPHIIRLRVGNVLFKYGNNICETEVTEDFCCSFCLVKCGSFMGLKYHLISSHDQFNFEFWISQKEQGVNVSLKRNTWTNEDFPAGVDPRQRTFSYFFILVIDLARKSSGTSVSDTSVDPAYSLHGGHLSPPRVLQFGKTRKLSVNQINPRNQQLLQKRQFFHSHTGQPMAFEEVLSDHDSEDEVDDDVADFEDRRMLDDFINVTKDEKCIMHMWNSFVSRQRVIADSHMPWACKAFSQLHGQLLARNPSLLRCWRFFMIKLWNHNLLDGRTMNSCNMIIDDVKSKKLGSQVKPMR